MRLYNQDVALGVLRAPELSKHLLRRSEDSLKEWNPIDATSEAYLQRNNEFDVVLCICENEPKFELRSQMEGFQRLTNKVYYDKGVARLVLSLSLQHKGNAKSVFKDLALHWVACGSECALLLSRLKHHRFQADLIDEVLKSPDVAELRLALINEATHHGEWEVIGHDATYKILMNIIGQDAMSQRPGESHAFHTFIGKTGALAGGCAQHTENGRCFEVASADVLPAPARQTTKIIFSDSPSTLEGHCADYPNLMGLAEDGLHFVIRIEECFGEKRVPLSRRLLLLQSKFRNPVLGHIYHGQDHTHGPPGTLTPTTRQNDSDSRDWNLYCQMPYSSHQQYINDILDLIDEFPAEMNRKNHKARTVKDILLSGVAYKHFGYLQNGSILLSSLSQTDRGRLSFGTCGNEAIHKQMKVAVRTVTEQHEDRVGTKMLAFALDNMLAHNSAAYWPTTCQYGQAWLLTLLQGHIKKTFFPSTNQSHNPTPIASRNAARRAIVPRDLSKTASRAIVSQKRAAQWKKEETKRIKKKEQRVPRPQEHLNRKRRTVFTMKKQACIKKRPAKSVKRSGLLKRPASQHRAG